MLQQPPNQLFLVAQEPDRRLAFKFLIWSDAGTVIDNSCPRAVRCLHTKCFAPFPRSICIARPIAIRVHVEQHHVIQRGSYTISLTDVLRNVCVFLSCTRLFCTLLQLTIYCNNTRKCFYCRERDGSLPEGPWSYRWHAYPVTRLPTLKRA